MTNVIQDTPLFVVIVVMTFLGLLCAIPNDIFALSPSFPLQVITNNHNQWSVVQVPQKIQKTFFPIPSGKIKLAKNISECNMHQRYPRPPGISAVSYISNGKTLNATLWLSNPLIQPPSNASAWWHPPFTEIPWYSIRYVMSIHVISVYDTGNADYAIEIGWKNNTWTKTTSLISPLGDDQKVLNQNNNYPVPLGKTYIDLSFDLGPLNYPNLYDILFYVTDVYVKDGQLCRMTDVASRVYVPPPEFSITAQPNTVSLRSGDERNVELKVTSSIAIKSQVSLLLNSPKYIQTSIIPNETSLPPNGLVTPSLSIKVLDRAMPRLYTLPIVANFSIPTEAKGTTTTQTNTLITQKAPGSNTVIPLHSILTLVVQSPYTIQEQLNNFVSSWITPINALWGFLAGLAVVIGPLILRRKQKSGVRTI